MVLFRRLLYLVILLLALGCMLVLGLLGENQELVSLHLFQREDGYIYETPEYSVFWWLLGAFGAGLLLGLLLLLIGNMKTALERRRLNKQLKRTDKELLALQAEVDQLKVERLAQVAPPVDEAAV